MGRILMKHWTSGFLGTSKFFKKIYLGVPPANQEKLIQIKRQMIIWNLSIYKKAWSEKHRQIPSTPSTPPFSPPEMGWFLLNHGESHRASGSTLEMWPFKSFSATYSVPMIFPIEQVDFPRSQVGWPQGRSYIDDTYTVYIYIHINI